MTPEEIKAHEEEIYAFVGREIYPLTPAPDDVNPAMIRHWAEVIGDRNPAYQDEEWAAGSSRGHTIAPPAMLYVWGQEGYQAAIDRAPNALSDLDRTLKRLGYSGVLGTNLSQEYLREVAVGENIQLQMVIDNISGRKNTARGAGYFYETLTNFYDGKGEKIGEQRFKVLGFAPKEQPAPAANDAGKLEVPTRIASVRGHDNGWWWNAVDQGRVLIQRCKSCQTLRHPPRPMCHECQSMEWDAIESTLEGEVLSYTCVRHPQVPGYPKDPICAVIKLAEGTNLVSNIAGCAYEAVSIGMKVKGRVERVDAKTMLPQFYPV